MANKYSLPIPNQIYEKLIYDYLYKESPTNAALFRFLILTGLSFDVATKYTVADIKDVDKLTIPNYSRYINEYVILIDDENRKILNALCEHKADTEYVFCSVRDRRLPVHRNTFQKALLKASAYFKIPEVSILSLRKTHILHCYNTYGAAVAKKLTGQHKTGALLDYLGLLPDDPKEKEIPTKRKNLVINGESILNEIQSGLSLMQTMIFDPTTPDCFFSEAECDLNCILDVLKKYATYKKTNN